jgi:uncharacterized membrane protein
MNKAQFEKLEIPNNRKIASVTIMFSSIAGFFLAGYHFDLFGNKIDFIQKPSTFLFFGFLLTGLFGIFYLFQPTKTAIKYTLIIAVLFGILYLVGKLSRGEF